MEDEEISRVGAGHEHDSGVPGFEQSCAALLHRERVMREAVAHRFHLRAGRRVLGAGEQILRRHLLD